MLNVDFKKLDAVSQFLDFINAISKPNELKATLEAMKTQADELRQLLGAKQTVDKANLFMDECRKEMQAGFDALSEKERKSAEDQAAKEALLNKRQEALEEQKRAQEKVAEQLEAATKRVEESNREVEVRFKKSAILEKTLEERETELNQREAAFVEKAAKLKQLMGEV